MSRALLATVCLFSLLALAPAAARAQVSAPSLIEEDLPEAAPAAAAEPALPAAGPPPTATEAAGARIPAPSPRPEAPPAPAPVRAIEPVRARDGDLLAAWQARRAALREQDVTAARAAGQRLLDLRLELAVENLEGLAAAEVRASGRALEGRGPAEAVAHAELAVALAPDLPAAHLALARARLAREPGQPGSALAELAAAAAAATREPHAARAWLADVALAALAAVAGAVALGIMLPFLRRLRLLLHDARHLPLLRIATPLEAGFITLAVLALPVALRLGPVAFLGALTLVAAPYLGRSERAVASAALLALAALPWGAGEAVRLTAWTGTLAEEVYALEHGAGDARVAARLADRAARGELPPAGLLALAHHHKRRGELDEALRRYQAAGTARPEALVGMGNVQLLRGEVEAAKASYLAAIDRAGGTGDLASLAAGHYDLSKIFLRQSALDQAQEARRKAAAADAALVARAGSDEDFRANRWLIDAPIPLAEIRALAVDDTPRAVEEVVRARLAGALPLAGWPWAPLALALAVWPMALLARRPGVSRACERCGRAACIRCDGVKGPLCGQCENVFVKKDVVEARDRLRKELQVRRRARNRRLATRVLGLVAGGAGHLWRGDAVRGTLFLLVLLFLGGLAVSANALVPPPYTLPWEGSARLAIFGGLALVVWALAVRDLFRRTRS